VEVVRGEVQRVGVGQQVAQALGNGAAVLFGDADVDVDFHGDSFDNELKKQGLKQVLKQVG
jgi:hypothetical protein